MKEYSYSFINAEIRLCKKCNKYLEARIFPDLPIDVQCSIIEKKDLEEPDDIVHFIEYEDYFYYCMSCGSILNKNGK